MSNAPHHNQSQSEQHAPPPLQQQPPTTRPSYANSNSSNNGTTAKGPGKHNLLSSGEVSITPIIPDSNKGQGVHASAAEPHSILGYGSNATTMTPINKLPNMTVTGTSQAPHMGATSKGGIPLSSGPPHVSNTNNSHHGGGAHGHGPSQHSFPAEDSSNDQFMDGRYQQQDEDSSGSYANDMSKYNDSEMGGNDSNYEQYDMRGHKGAVRFVYLKYSRWNHTVCSYEFTRELLV